MNDPAKTPVARFYCTMIGNPRPASLEIRPAGKDMIDLIVVTGVYMEKKRSERNERAAYARQAGVTGKANAATRVGGNA